MVTHAFTQSHIHAFYILHFCCKDTSFIFVTRWLHMVADLSLSNQLFNTYTLILYEQMSLLSFVFKS